MRLSIARFVLSWVIAGCGSEAVPSGPEVLFTTRALGAVREIHIAGDALYFVAGDLLEPHSLYRGPKSGGRAIEILRGGPDLFVVLDGATIYAASGESGLVAIPSAGGEPRRRADVPGNVSSIAVDETHVYLALSGTTTGEVTEGSQAVLSTTGAAIARVPKAGGELSRLLSLSSPADSLARIGERIVWRSALNEPCVYSAVLGADAAQCRPAHRGYVTSMASDRGSQTLVWFEGISYGGKVLARTGADGTDRVLLDASQMSFVSVVAVDATHATISIGSSLRRVAHSGGGGAREITPPAHVFFATAFDATHVYWAIPGHRIARTRL
jgi:hypothetical protein